MLDGRGGFLAPGFVDLHVHGACRRDAMEATEDAFAAILDFQASGDTTVLALTSVILQENGCGSLRPGLASDFVLLSPDLEVRATYSAGRCIYRSRDKSRS